MHKQIDFLNLKLNAISRKEMVEALLELCKKGRPARVAVYINAHCVNISFSDIEYRNILNGADLVYGEGQGVVWAAGFSGRPLPERVNILDFFDIFLSKLIDKKITVYLLGNTDEIVKKTEFTLKSRGVDVIGSRSGFFSESDNPDIIREINGLKPDIVMIGMGVPKQEKWIKKYSHELDTGLCWAVGAAFEWICGYRKRAPFWMIKLGLEWLHRLFQEPGRLWKRYLFGNVVFIYHVLCWNLKRAINFFRKTMRHR